MDKRKVARVALYVSLAGQLFASAMMLGEALGRREANAKWSGMVAKSADAINQCTAELRACDAGTKKALDGLEQCMTDEREVACACAKAMAIPTDPRLKCER